MSVMSSIAVRDRHGNELLVEFDGTTMNAFVGTNVDDVTAAVELDEPDRARLRDFLTVNS